MRAAIFLLCTVLLGPLLLGIAALGFFFEALRTGDSILYVAGGVMLTNMILCTNHRNPTP